MADFNKIWIRVKPLNYKLINGNQKQEIQDERGAIEKFVKEQQSNGFTLFVSKYNSNIRALSKDEKTKEWLVSQGFNILGEEPTIEEEEPQELDATTGAENLMAKHTDIDFSTIQGTGANGRIMKGDVQDFLEQKDNG